MKSYIAIIILLIVFYFVFQETYLTIKNDSKSTYIKGDSTIVYIHDTTTVIKEIPIERIKYVTHVDTLILNDTIKIVNEVVSIFRDSTENYLLEVKAYSPEPVRKFIYDLNLITDSVIITRVDTLTRIEKEIDLKYVLGALALGLLL